MKLKLFTEALQGLLRSSAYTPTARHIRSIRPVARVTLLDQHQVRTFDGLLSFSCAGRRILAGVSLGISPFKGPGIVTLPGLLGCSKCLWLPLVPARNQPSASTSLVASRTFNQVALALHVKIVRHAQRLHRPFQRPVELRGFQHHRVPTVTGLPCLHGRVGDRRVG